MLDWQTDIQTDNIDFIGPYIGQSQKWQKLHGKATSFLFSGLQIR